MREDRVFDKICGSDDVVDGSEDWASLSTLPGGVGTKGALPLPKEDTLYNVREYSRAVKHGCALARNSAFN